MRDQIKYFLTSSQFYERSEQILPSKQAVEWKIEAHFFLQTGRYIRYQSEYFIANRQLHERLERILPSKQVVT